MNGIVEVLIPVRGDAGFADNGPDDAPGGGGGAVVVHAHRDGFADHAGEVGFADGETEDRQAGVVQGVGTGHAGETVGDGLVCLTVVGDARGFVQCPTDVPGEQTVGGDFGQA